jgi:hypothetical protein
MDKKIIHEAVQILIPDTCQIIGDEKLDLIIDHAVSSDGSTNESFITPEHGHPAHFIEEIRVAVQTVASLVAILSAINRVRGRMQEDNGGNPDETSTTRLERLKKALIRLITNIK